MKPKYKQDILRLRAQGLGYKRIAKALGCVTSTVVYHCSPMGVQNDRKRQKRRGYLVLLDKKVWRFAQPRSSRTANYHIKANLRMTRKIQDFQRVPSSTTKIRRKYQKIQFNAKDVIIKFGMETECYLTGHPIRLDDPASYEFDHIVPVAQEGDSTINNLGIASREANRAKNDRTVPQFLNLCKRVLEHHGYSIKKDRS